MKTVINVANRLPVTLGNTIRKSSGGLVAALEGISSDQFSLQSVGWPGAAVESEEIRSKLENEFNCIPVFLDDDQIDGYYHGLSNSSLWPLLHYNRAYMHYTESDWQAYVEVNQKFADALLDLVDEDDDDTIIWVHDYHLMLLPELLRKARPELKIGFFLHTPFPSSEIIRCHPRREELIRGMLGADLIGFHTSSYLRHFRSSALQLLGLESEMTTIASGNHEASLGVFPIGINSQSFEREVLQEEFHETLAEYRNNWKDKRIVLSVERLDYSKGLLRRLEAIETFLSSSDQARDVVFVFISVPTRGEVTEYQQLREKIEREVGRINGSYASVKYSPIHFIHQSIPFTELCALYAIADVALVTPLVDGMNLVAKEYIACQHYDPQNYDPGVLILSEFAGAAQELVNALIVNPYDSMKVATAIDTALSMPLDERKERMGYMTKRVLEFDANHWAGNFLQQLIERRRKSPLPQAMGDSEAKILEALQSASKPALFLDYDGTLRGFEDKPDQATPDTRLRELLSQLAEAPIDIYIISGRPASFLEEWLGDYPFTLIGEHGNCYRKPGDSEWETLNPNVDFNWKGPVRDAFKLYEGSTPGSAIEEKQSSLVWHYRQSEPVFAQWKANQLVHDLFDMLGNSPVEIHHGKRIVEVSSIHVNKGRAMEHFIREQQYNFVLCAGDDQTDEAMFKLEEEGLVSIKVGGGDSQAQHRVSDVDQFLLMLERIATGFQNIEKAS
ncbi:MAG: trehalose 6-phosphate synthase/phosphatase [Halioglobus sp.]|jgi:trehalose 6-phosphate synthase/phosphatase